MKKISIDIPHFYCLEYKEDEKRLIVEIDFREPEIWISKSLIQHPSTHGCLKAIQL